jgi:hypothetical protein
MKDFERKLEQQPMREIPTGWRREILAAAERNQRSASTPTVSEDQVALVTGWRLLLGRLPLAWSAVAALWLVLLGANLMLPSAGDGVTTQLSSPMHLSNLAALELLTSEFDVTADTAASIPDSAPSPKPTVTPQRPRSEIRHGSDIGEVDFEFRAVTIV